MGFDKVKIKQIRNLMLLCAGLVLGIIYSDYIVEKIGFVISILSTFVIGVGIAFVINIPMSFFERVLFQKTKSKRLKAAAQPISLVLALLAIIAVIVLVTAVVIPQMVRTMTELATVIPQHISVVQHKLESMFVRYPWIIEQLEKVDIHEIDWMGLTQNIMHFFTNGVGNAVSGTFTVAGKVVGAVIKGVIAFIFAMYALLQKERLINQMKRILHAYIPIRGYLWIRKTTKLLANNFKNFITGQCLEAVIIGTMFVLVLSVLRIPYALLIGVLIAFTALIPIVGAFIGFFISLFLVLMVSPIKALIFAVAFVIIQQFEGNVIYPKVVGDSVGLPAIWVLAAVSVGSSLMGVLGMLTFIPLTATLYTLIRDDVNARNNGRTKIK